jgi:hypothetical protein
MVNGKERRKQTWRKERNICTVCFCLDSHSHTQVRRGCLLSFGRCVGLCMCRPRRTCLMCVVCACCMGRVWRMAVCIGDIGGGDGAGVSPKLLSLSIALPELKLFWVSGRWNI